MDLYTFWNNWWVGLSRPVFIPKWSVYHFGRERYCFSLLWSKVSIPQHFTQIRHLDDSLVYLKFVQEMAPIHSFFGHASLSRILVIWSIARLDRRGLASLGTTWTPWTFHINQMKQVFNSALSRFFSFRFFQSIFGEAGEWHDSHFSKNYKMGKYFR